MVHDGLPYRGKGDQARQVFYEESQKRSRLVFFLPWFYSSSMSSAMLLALLLKEESDVLSLLLIFVLFCQLFFMCVQQDVMYICSPLCSSWFFAPYLTYSIT